MNDSDEYELDLFEEQLNKTHSTAKLNLNLTDVNDSEPLVYTVEPYEPPESLWQLIKSIANEKELDVIKSILGQSVIETSIDLHNEIDTLLEIWRDYRNETMVSLNQIKQNLNKTSTNLPEPPNIRDTLKKEIRFFVTQMREVYKEEDKFCRQIVANNHNLNVINYALNSNSSSTETVYDLNQSKLNMKMNIKRSSSTGSMAIERPQTSINKRTGIETPIIVNTSRVSAKTPGSGRQSRQRIRYRPVSRANSVDSSRTITSMSNYYQDDIKNNTFSSKLSENVELVVDEDKINCMDIDEIADHLKKLFHEECETLKNDIEFLYECIDKEKDYREKSRDTLREPSLNELKEERKRLEADLVSSTGRNQIQISKLPASVSVANNNRSIRSPVMTNRITPSPPPSPNSIKSRSSIVPIVKKPLINTELNKNSKQSDNSMSNGKTRSSSVITVDGNKNKLLNNGNIVKSTAFNSTYTTTSKIAAKTSTTNSNSSKPKENNMTDLRPILSRTNSVSSVASSVASSISSTNSKQSAVQKFRQMVLEHRD